MEYPKFEDEQEKQTALLKRLVENTGGLGDLDPSRDVTIENQAVGSRVGTIEPRDLSVTETDDLEDAEGDGTMKVEPGETKTFLTFQGPPHAILAVGASDHTDADYHLEADNQYPIGGTTKSPLGSINEPFSFVRQFGGAPHAEQRTRYKIYLDSSASAPIYVAGRLFVEVLA